MKKLLLLCGLLIATNGWAEDKKGLECINPSGNDWFWLKIDFLEERIFMYLPNEPMNGIDTFSLEIDDFIIRWTTKYGSYELNRSTLEITRPSSSFPYEVQLQCEVYSVAEMEKRKKQRHDNNVSKQKI